MNIAQIIEANGLFFTLAFSATSLAAVFLVALKFLRNHRAHTDFDKYVQQLEQELESRGGAGVRELCKRQSVETHWVVARLFHAAFRDGNSSMIAARDAMADTLETDVMPSLNSVLPHMLLLAKIAPMLGLLGTVVGMILAFDKIAGATRVNPQDLSRDIGMALYTTAEGLFIAIPLILFYTVFVERVRRFEIDLQRASQAALRLLPRVNGKAGG